MVGVGPLVVAALEPLGRGRRAGRIAGEPAPHVVVVELLAPEQSGQGLPHHLLRVRGQVARDDRGVELVRLPQAAREDRLELAAEGLVRERACC